MSIVVHGFTTSNDLKVRVALGYKQLPFEFRAIDPQDRETVLRLTGQRLTPVLEHEGRVIFDSAAILRYLDANFRESPSLFGADREEPWAIEGWERFGRGPLADPMMEVLRQKMRGGDVDEAMRARCSAAFAAGVERIDAALAGGEWLVGDALSAADLSTAPVCFRIRGAGMLDWPGTHPRVDAWVDRVMAFDPDSG
jgi:glutathione S-transferase